MIFRRPWCTEIFKGVEKEGTILVTEPVRPNDSSLSVWRIKRLQSRAKLFLTILVHLKAILLPFSMSDLTSYDY